MTSRRPSGFAYEVRRTGEVRITRHGRIATTLRGVAAARFLIRVENDALQQLMARVTGDYKHGNERVSSDHPRNRTR